jgi:hypothetical protein
MKRVRQFSHVASCPHESPYARVALQVFGLDVCFLGEDVVRPVVAMQWLRMCTRADGKTDCVHDLQL